MTAIIAAAVALALVRGQIFVAGISTAIVLLVALQLQVFVWVSGDQANWNAAFGYFPAASVAVFYNLGDELSRVLRFMFYGALAYCVAYIYFSNAPFVTMPASAVWTPLADAGGAADTGARVLLSAGGRGARLYLAAGYAAFCLFYALARIRQGGAKLRWWLALGVAALAIYLSMSRLITIIILAVAALALLRLLGRPVRAIIALAFAALVLVNLAGVLFPYWNPYAPFTADPSGLARAVAYEVLRPQIARHLLFGIGIAPDVSGFAAYIGRDYVFWADLGPFGMWASFGLSGLLCFLALAHLCIRGVERPSRLDPTAHRALSLTGLSFGLAATFSPDLWAGSSAVAVNILLAIWLRSLVAPTNQVAAHPISRLQSATWSSHRNVRVR
jgi:hypothetical protein